MKIDADFIIFLARMVQIIYVRLSAGCE